MWRAFLLSLSHPTRTPNLFLCGFRFHGFLPVLCFKLFVLQAAQGQAHAVAGAGEGRTGAEAGKGRSKGREGILLKSGIGRFVIRDEPCEDLCIIHSHRNFKCPGKRPAAQRRTHGRTLKQRSSPCTTSGLGRRILRRTISWFSHPPFLEAPQI